ncbi:RHS repeat-associated core domain-containing protein [Dyella sp. 2HG41-7]|uniref:RHS repeat-associated core domain-containing protein n=1 Tax=Dyella sp. 2HG41-7 TaxID=2883239 RepID=UPI001F37957A|nr:RHS repeat-associated core domain-containing protein [Dyella sp. 2HG41-7]
MKGERDPRDSVMTSVHRSRMSLLTTLAVTAAMAACVSPVMAQTANTKTTYTYDALDRLTQVTDPSGLNTTYQYDGLSDPITLTSPDTGVTARTFDAAGNVLTGTDANQNTVTYTYDAQNRRLSASYTDSTQNITYTYDEPNTATGCSTSYPIGHLTHIVENTVTTAFCYNAQGYVTQVSQTINGTTDVTTYTRSPGGKILSITHPSGDQVTYSYDTDGRISGVTATTASGTSTLVSNVSYQPFGPISGYTLGNGQAITRTYDANYRLTDLVSPAFTLHVARDAMGDITAIGNNTGANPATETYSYDPLYRLTQITEADGSTLENVTYNPTGDRLTKTGSGLATGAYSYNPNTHQLVATGNAARTVDADGNTTAIAQAGSTYGFGYNARNRMTLAQLNQSTVANYTYNAEGERVAKTANGNTERYNYGPSSQLLSEYGATNREYVYLDDIPVANLDTQGTTSSIAYVTADQLGTPRAIADNNGNTEWSWAYQGNAWGEQSPTSNGYTYNPRFPGQYADAETGLNYNVNRDYDSGTGRYIESDPMGLRAGSSTYAYVGGNSLDHVDSLGLQETGQTTVDAYCARYGAEACAEAVSGGQASSSAGSNGAAALGGAALGAAAAGLSGDSKQCPSDDCAALIAQINAHVALMEEVYDDMLIDEHDLYRKAFNTKLPGDAAYWGTWVGHVDRYEGLRKGLQAMIARAEAKGCTVPPKAYQMANSPAPAWPVSSYD